MLAPTSGARFLGELVLLEALAFLELLVFLEHLAFLELLVLLGLLEVQPRSPLTSNV